MEMQLGNASVAGASFAIDTSKEPGAIERLDQELSWLDETIGTLEAKLGPILSQYAQLDQSVSQPKPEPASQFRARLEQLEVLRFRLGQIIERVDL